ncbi:hypothetical protein [Gloeocapsa sp. PCC 73106]|uniref:hypothetical protein n=1 Tax=Gloeocapsa sp. PCC 73106 TaxID=102232 RepID=UPI0002ACCB7F|nr:hypothetical protein [Gloeocapsa sp. PCC 73106]ELR99518.1 hypothetical protein GLO73106DRAFT_00033700 [Gloeocapsa sp. PCC 73106]
MLKRILFALLWLTFIVYAFFLAPSDRPDTITLITNLATGNWEGINPLVISLFNLMGIWPMIYACILLIDGRKQKIPAWPFALGSFAVGAFALLPYLVLRDQNLEFQGEKNLVIKLLDSRITGLLLLIGACVLLWFGLSHGDWQNFGYQWQNSRFINVMSLDFCLLAILFPTLVQDDLARRKAETTQPLLAICFIPLIGPLIYLCLRPGLPG